MGKFPTCGAKRLDAVIKERDLKPGTLSSEIAHALYETIYANLVQKRLAVFYYFS